MIHQVIQVQIDENLKCHDDLEKIRNEMQNGNGHDLGHDSEGSEDFHTGQTSNKDADFEEFSKLLR